LTFNCTCTRCGGTGEGVTAQQAKFSCKHKVGCGRKIGIVTWGTVPKTKPAESQETPLPEPKDEVKTKKKKKSTKKKVEE